MTSRMFLTAALAVLGGFACAQADLIGKDQFPQFRGLSGLPGGGFGLSPNGKLGSYGAFALSTPIGYTLGHTKIVLSYSAMSSTLAPKLGGFNRSASGVNITANGMIGVELGDYGRIAGSNMVLSSIGDNAVNFQYQFPLRGDTQVSVGIQDITGRGGSAGESQPTDGDASISYFIASTKEIRPGTYISGGFGTRRFQKGFLSASTKVAERTSAMIEHDGFNFNAGLLYTLPYREDREDDNLSMFLGVVRGKYLTWSLSFSF